MKVKILRAIPHRSVGETVEMSEELAKSYGSDYVRPVKVEKRNENRDKKDDETSDGHDPESEKEEDTKDVGEAARNAALLTTHATK